MSCFVGGASASMRAMAMLAQQIEAEVRMRELLELHGLPLPDAVEYGYTCVRLYWKEAQMVVVVDLDEPAPGCEPSGIDEDSMGAEVDPSDDWEVPMDPM